MALQLLGAVQLGFLYALMALGVYVTFRILDLPDLTVDGSITLGMAVSAVVSVSGHPFLALVLGMIAGAAAGLVTGALQTKLSIHPILAGILTMTGLYTINLFVMGEKSNISLTGKDTVFSLFQKWFGLNAEACKLIIPILLVVIVTVILAVFFRTKTGMAIRATGDNEEMVRSSSINANLSKCLGLAIGNACVGLAGAAICQYQLFADVSYGTGMVVIGLASVIIGETVVGKRGVTSGLTAAIVGAVIYRIIIAIALKFSIFPAYALKLISSVIVGIALAMPVIKASFNERKARKQVNKNE